jgi:hypothetical protein
MRLISVKTKAKLGKTQNIPLTSKLATIAFGPKTAKSTSEIRDKQSFWPNAELNTLWKLPADFMSVGLS